MGKKDDEKKECKAETLAVGYIITSRSECSIFKVTLLKHYVVKRSGGIRKKTSLCS